MIITIKYNIPCPKCETRAKQLNSWKGGMRVVYNLHCPKCKHRWSIERMEKPNTKTQEERFKK